MDDLDNKNSGRDDFFAKAGSGETMTPPNPPSPPLAEPSQAEIPQETTIIPSSGDVTGPIPSSPIPSSPIPSSTIVTTSSANKPFYTKKTFILLLLFLILAISIPVFIYLGVKRQQSTVSKASGQCCSGTPECGNGSQCKTDTNSDCYKQGKGVCQDTTEPAGCCSGDPDCAPWESCRISNGACKSGKSCGAKQCKGEGGSCGGNWECCNGVCDMGHCHGGGGGATPTPRPPEAICQAEGGTLTETCTADPNCITRGGKCCTKNGINNCCYGDSSTKPDGACYAGGASGVSCSGNTIKNNTAPPIEVKIRHFSGSGSDNKCPISAAGGADTSLAPGASVSAGGCEQIEAVGYCGVCNDSSCQTVTPTTPVTPTTTVTPTTPPVVGQCRYVKVYDEAWTLITDFTKIAAGQKIFLTVAGSDNNFDRGRFKINNGGFLPSDEGTVQTNANNEFYIEYTIPTDATSITVAAMVHHKTLGWK